MRLLAQLFSARRYPMFWVALFIIAGIVLCEHGDASSDSPYYVLSILLVVGLLSDLIFRRSVLFVYSLFMIGGYALAYFSHTPLSEVEYDHRGFFVGVVQEDFSPRGKWHRTELDVIATEDSSGVWSAGGYSLFCNLDSTSYSSISAGVGTGDTIIIKGRLRDIEGGYGRYVGRRGIVGQVYSYEVALFGVSSHSVQRWVSELRASATQKIMELDTSQSAASGVVSAMVVGDRAVLHQEQVDEYRQAGVAHLLAISGLHIGIVVVLLNVLLGSLKLLGRRGRVLFCVVIILALWFYAVFSGMAVSVQRAAIMFTLYQVAVIMHRSGTSLNVLSTAAAITLILEPFSLYSIGFQLSFMAMVGISLFYSPLMSLVSIRSSVLRALLSAVAVSIGAQLGVLPLIAYHFGEVPWFGVVLSIFIWLTIPVIIFSALLYLLSSVALLGHVALWVTGLQNAVFATVASWEWVVVRDVRLGLWGVVVAYAVIFMGGLLLKSYTQRRSRYGLIRLKQIR